MAVKLLGFSDLHNNVDFVKHIVEVSGRADVLIGAGDFGIEGSGAEAVLEVLSRAAVPTVIVSGNHDRVRFLSKLCAQWENVHLLHGDAATIAGVTFFGLGAETPRREQASWSESLSEATAAALLATCPPRSVLVTHTPPFGYADWQADGTHEGSHAILDTINRCRPRLHLCGHIHHCWGVTARCGTTVVHNLGPRLNWFDLTPSG